MPSRSILKKVLDRHDIPETIKENLIEDLNQLFNYQQEYSRMLEVNIEALTNEVEDFKQKMEANQALILEKSKMATIGEVTATLSHEINNQLMIVSGNCQVMEMINESKIKNPMLKKSIETSLKTLSSMSELIKNIKRFSYHSNESVKLVDESPVKLFKDTLNVCDHFLSKSKVKVLTDFKIQDSFMCSLAPSELGQVLLNLVKNAFDHSVQLEDDSSWIKLTLESQGSNVKFRVSNGGKLLDEKITSRLFNPFFTTKEIGKGTGIGLSLCKKIVESMNGSIKYEPYENSISFVVEIPCSNCEKK